MNAREFLEQQGYVSLTMQYILPEQDDILDNAVRQLAKGGRNYFLLEDEDTVEIFVPRKDVVEVEGEA